MRERTIGVQRREKLTLSMAGKRVGGQPNQARKIRKQTKWGRAFQAEGTAYRDVEIRRSEE